VTEQSSSQSTTGTGAPARRPIAAARGSQIVQSLAGSPNPATVQNTGATVVKRMTFREAASVIANPEGRGDHRQGHLAGSTRKCRSSSIGS
jgi:MSHA biogenesis protein MshL